MSSMKVRPTGRWSCYCMDFLIPIRVGTSLSLGSPLGGIGAWRLTSRASLTVRGRLAAGITACLNWLIDASGAQRVHLVGNDFGAMVAWALAADSPERLVSLTTMSIAHPVATLKAMATSWQALASWYVLFFQLSRIPERYLLAKDGNVPRMSTFMQSKAHQPREAPTAMPTQWPSPECSPPPSTGIARSRCHPFSASARSLSPPRRIGCSIDCR